MASPGQLLAPRTLHLSPLDRAPLSIILAIASAATPQPSVLHTAAPAASLARPVVLSLCRQTNLALRHAICRQNITPPASRTTYTLTTTRASPAGGSISWFDFAIRSVHTTVPLQVRRKMQAPPIAPTPSKPSATHLALTASKARENVRAVVKLVAITNETPTIKSFKFSVVGVFDDPHLIPTYVDPGDCILDCSPNAIKRFSFKPGQWIDLFTAHIPIVGGFSITSTPHQLETTNTIELAVKAAFSNPVVRWLHNTIRIGDTAQFRVGGEFYLRDDREDGERDVVLIAGGVGATPMISMATHVGESNLRAALAPLQPLPNGPQLGDGGRSVPRRTAVVLFSAKEAAELLFRERLESLASNPQSGVDLRFMVTREDVGGSASDRVASPTAANGAVPFIRHGRVDRAVLAQCLNDCRKRRGGANPLVYLCGPAVFEQAVLGHLEDLGFPSSNVRFEKWW